MASGSDHKHSNRLATQESPYLLQHAHNPVDWYPWGEEAFKKAKDESKPIFLSVGYSTCHWCHVMERESFEDEATAELMNKYFVNIKVDREERPDIDKVYMMFVQATTGGGGWPMSVFLTPDLQPFVGGTYFPPKDMYGRPSFSTMLRRIAELWQTRRDDILEQGADIAKQMAEAFTAGDDAAQSSSSTEDVAALSSAALQSCAKQLASRFDEERGGFGSAPKFPRPCEISALLRHHVATLVRGDDDGGAWRRMAVTTLERMAAGGMYDHVGGGFHRYSVDECWHVPHFEKMLYDNPQLAVTYLAAFSLTGDAQHARVARGVLDYLRRDMTHPDGGLFSAEDADSMDIASSHKKEGLFYLWTTDEIHDAINDPAMENIFNFHYYVKPRGNCDLSPRSDPHDEFVDKNCLIALHSTAETAEHAKRSVDEVESVLAECRQRLHDARVKRPRPSLDDKIVTAWNGMGISAFALASRTLRGDGVAKLFPVEGCDAREYMQAALRIASFVRDSLYDGTSKRLRRSFCRGPSVVEGFADDYAYLISGLLDLYEVGGDIKWLQWAAELQATMDDLFWDNSGGGYFQTSGDDPSVLMRMKEDYDGAEPAASSIAAANLHRLSGFFRGAAGDAYARRAVRCATAFSGRLRDAALALPQMCCSLDMIAPTSHASRTQVVIVGAAGADDTEALLDTVFSVFVPDKTVIHLNTNDKSTLAWWRETNAEAVAIADAALQHASSSASHAASAYICRDYTCQAPTSDPAKVKQLLTQSLNRQSSAPVSPTRVDISSLLKKKKQDG